MGGNNMAALYLIANFFLVLIFMRNYNGIQKKISARLFMIVFAITLILAVLFPNKITTIANFFGIGRGADFVFYNFIIFTIGMIGILYKKNLYLERKLIELNRQVATNEALKKWDK
jgi:hypothetical protein